MSSSSNSWEIAQTEGLADFYRAKRDKQVHITLHADLNGTWRLCEELLDGVSSIILTLVIVCQKSKTLSRNDSIDMKGQGKLCPLVYHYEEEHSQDTACLLGQCHYLDAMRLLVSLQKRMRTHGREIDTRCA